MFYLERPNDVPGTWYSEDHGGFVNGFDSATPYPSQDFAEQIIVDLDMEDPENVRVVYHEDREPQEIADTDIVTRVDFLGRQMALLHRKLDALLEASGIDIPQEDPEDSPGEGEHLEG